MAAAHLGTFTKRHALDGVYGRDGISTSEIGSHSRLGDVGNVGCHLWDDGDFHIAFHISGEECNQFGILSYVATHTTLTHLWTGVVQFHGVATGVLSHLGELNPVFLGLSHNAGNDHFLRIVLLEAVEDVEIHFVGIL